MSLLSPERDYSESPHSLRPYQKTASDILIRSFIQHLESEGFFGGETWMKGEDVSERQRSKPLNIREVMREPSNQCRAILSGEELHPLSSQSSYLDQSSGSGKTLTVAHTISRILNLKNTFLKDTPLRILVLSDRISSIDQLSDDFFKNTQERRALLPAAIRERVKHLTIHSQSDDIFASEEDMRKNIVSGGENGGETIVFSTIQSALKSTDGNIGYDLIIIDEADNSIRSEGENLAALELIADIPGPLGVRPHIIPMSGTPDRDSLSIFGSPVYSYSMDAFLLSPWAPYINYHLMADPDVSEEELANLTYEIRAIQAMEYSTKKKKALSEFRDKLDAILLRMKDYESLAKHMREKIDLSEKTLIFTPKIEDAKRLREALVPLLQDQGISVVDIHSESDQSDHSIIEAFRDNENPLQVLIAVDKLNRSIDVPDCRNIVFLRDTNSKKIFLQQLARALRGEDTQIYDYVMNLSNIAYLHDIQERASRQLYSTRGIPNKESKIKLFFGRKPLSEEDGDDNDSGNHQDVRNSRKDIDFYALCGLYLSERSALETASLGTTRESILSTLKEHNIRDYEELKKFGSKKFQETFGVSDLGTFLGERVKILTLDTLYDLAKKLGWSVPEARPSEEKSLGTTRESILSILKEHNIRNYEDLKKFRPTKFKQTFGVSDLGTFLGERVKILTLDTLYDLAKKLGWSVPEARPSEEKSLGTTRESILSTLEQHNIRDYEDLKKFGPTKFEQTFGKSDLGIFLGERVKILTLDTLYDLAKKLGWSVPEARPSEERKEKIPLGTTREEILHTLEQYDIRDYEDLKKFGPTKFQQTFGVSDLGTFLGERVKILTLDTLYNLAKKLGWSVPEARPSEEKSLGTTRESILSTLEQHNIRDYEDLKKFGPTKFEQTFGKSDLGIFLGERVKILTLDTLYDLAKKLGWSVPEARPSEERKEKIPLGTTREEILHTLKQYDIRDYEDLKKFGPKKFEQTFGKSDLGIFLGERVKILTLDTLYDLAKKLGWSLPEVRPSEEKEEKIPLGTTREEILQTLEQYDIRDYEDLKKFGPTKFEQTFGKSDLGIFLGERVKILTLDTLYDLAKKLGWEVPEVRPSEEKEEKIPLGTTREEILQTLKQYDIRDYEELKKYGSQKFKQTFGVSDLGTFLGEVMKTLTLDTLYDLAKKLGWSVPEKKPSESRKSK